MSTQDTEKERMLDLIIDKDAEIARLKEWNRRFFDRVRYLRTCQREYFDKRTQDAMHRSMAVEKEIDAEIAKLTEGLEARAARRKVEEAAQLLIDEYGFEAAQPLQTDGAQQLLNQAVYAAMTDRIRKEKAQPTAAMDAALMATARLVYTIGQTSAPDPLQYTIERFERAARELQKGKDHG